MWLFLGPGFSGGRVCCHTVARLKTNMGLSDELRQPKTPGVVDRESNVTGACRPCTCAATKLVKSLPVCHVIRAERLTNGSDE